MRLGIAAALTDCDLARPSLRRANAQDAFALGLASEVFSDKSFKESTNAVLSDLIQKAPSALLGLKQYYLAAERMPLGEFVELEARRHLEVIGPEATEAFMAFMEKRQSDFK